MIRSDCVVFESWLVASKIISVFCILVCSWNDTLKWLVSLEWNQSQISCCCSRCVCRFCHCWHCCCSCCCYCCHCSGYCLILLGLFMFVYLCLSHHSYIIVFSYHLSFSYIVNYLVSIIQSTWCRAPAETISYIHQLLQRVYCDQPSIPLTMKSGDPARRGFGHCSGW